jgi:ankyrin repeat protein
MKNIKKRMSIILSLAIFGGVAPLPFEAGVHAVDGEDAKTQVVRLFSAVEDKDIYTVRSILDGGTNPNVANSYGVTALFWAAMYGYTEIVKLLLGAGADPNVANSYGMTALHRAAMYGYTEIVKLLLTADADPNVATKAGITALFWAKMKGHTKIVKLLLAAGTNVDDDATRENIEALGLATYT